MDARRPQLNATELQQLRWLLGGTIALFTAVSVLLLEVEAWWIVLVTIAAVLAGLIRPDLPARLPRWIHPAAFPVIGSAFLFDLWSGGEILPSLVRLDLMLILYRCISYRERRDDLQLILLGLFLIIVAGVITVSLAFSLQIILFTAFSLALLFVLNLSESAPLPQVRDEEAQRKDTPVPAWAREVRWLPLLHRVRSTMDGRVAALLVALFAGVVGLSALLFLSIPRFQLENSLFLDRLISKKARTGFSESVKFGDVTEIVQDNSLALTVDVPDPTRLPSVPYWRMLVLDEYLDTGGFRLSPLARQGGFGAERLTIQIPGARRSLSETGEQWVFYFESGLSRFLPIPGSFASLRFREVQNVQYSRRLEVVSLRNEPATMTAYRVESPTLEKLLPDEDFARWITAAPRDDFGRTRRTLRLLLELPPEPSVQSRLSQKVLEIVGGAAGQSGTLSAAEFSRLACTWLERRHAYSLSSRIPGSSGDPLLRWLDSGSAGHCEFFAGSFVLLARAAGFPSRMVIGFKGGSLNAFSNSLTVRNSDAHAWCEIWDASAGAWRRVDPTPGAETADSSDGTLASQQKRRELDDSWNARLESLRVFWYRRIVNFDQRTQIEAVQALKKAAQEGGEALRAAWAKRLERWLAWMRQPWDGRRWISVVGSAAALAAFCWALWRFRTEWRWRSTGPRTGRRGLHPVRREAGRWLARLRKRGLQDTPEGRGLEVDLLRLRYGSAESWPEPADVFRKARAWRRPKIEAKLEK